MTQQSGLGRGLSSLIPQKNNRDQEGGRDERPRDAQPAAAKKDVQPSPRASKENPAKQNGEALTVAIDKITVNPHQPRTHFDQEKLTELMHSIRVHGILQPLIVIEKNDGNYELIAGERRLQASKKAGLTTVPVVVRSEETYDQAKLELALIENIQRQDLNVIEEARAYKSLAQDFALSQEEIAVRTGKSRSAVANRMRLLQLPVEVQRALMERKITEGHAKAILALSNPEKQRALFALITQQNLTVRQAEEKTKGISVRSHKRSRKDARLQSLEDGLSAQLGTKVKVSGTQESGKITIGYYSQEELDNISRKLNNSDINS